MNVIASLKHTHKHHEHITFWSPNHCGYTPVLGRAGHYNDVEGAKHNDGIDYMAIPLHLAVELSSPTPYYKPGKQFYDMAGPVVDNTKANWNALFAARMEAGRPSWKPKKPEIYKGKRRCLPSVEARMNKTETQKVLAVLRAIDRTINDLGEYEAPSGETLQEILDITIALCDASLARVVEPVGTTSNMPGTEGFTMACFKACDVPVGAELFLSAPQEAAAPDGQATLNNLRNAVNIFQSYVDGNASAHLAQASINAFNQFIDETTQ